MDHDPLRCQIRGHEDFAGAGRPDAVRGRDRVPLLDAAAGHFEDWLSGTIGRNISTSVPSPTALSILSRPPARRANSLAPASPKPRPPAAPLVVKKGSTHRLRTSGDMPTPQSCSPRTIYSIFSSAKTSNSEARDLRADRTIRPPSGMAAWALATGVTKTTSRSN